MAKPASPKKPKRPLAKWHGDGSVFQRKDGRWVASVPYKDNLGVPKRVEKYYRSDAEAWEGWQGLLQQRADGLLGATELETVTQLVDAWLETIIKPNVKPQTYFNYKRSMRDYVVEHIGHIKLAELSSRHVQVLVNKLVARGLAPGTVRFAYRLLKSALKQAIQWNILSRNVGDGARLPRANKAKAKVFTTEEARIFLRAIRGHRLEAYFAVALSLGLRRGEALGLRWQDVDLEKKQIYIRVNLQLIERRMILSTPKTESSEAPLSLPAPLIAQLKAHKIRQIEERLQQGDKWKDWEGAGLLFTWSDGRPISGAVMLHKLRAILAKAGLPRLTIHELRKSCATLLHAQGVPDKEIQMIMRHSSINTTRSLYIQAVESIQRAALDNLGELLFGE
jgi:integrase